MLVEFTFENFKCYKNSTTLRMEAASIDEHSDTLIQGLGTRRILPVSAIYGPNGGGKSSILQAFECLCDKVTLPYHIMRHRKSNVPSIHCRPYAFQEENKDRPTTFFVLFEAAGFTYRYILSIHRGCIIEEYLHRRMPGKGKQATLFERANGNIELGSSLKRKGINTSVDEMMPYLSFLAINYSLESVDSAFEFFRSCLFLDYSQAAIEEIFMEPKQADDREHFIQILNSMDINISNIRFQEDDNKKVEIFLQHKTEDGIELELSEESNGTIKVLSLIPHIMIALKLGNLIASDELDAKLHPKLLKYIIRLFTNKETNPKGAQLLFTSHDISTLNSSTFRRDEIWFAAKTQEGPSHLYSLADIADNDGRRIRTGNAYDKQYLAGRYGADPYLSQMASWNDNE